MPVLHGPAENSGLERLVRGLAGLADHSHICLIGAARKTVLEG
jgi:hypothetical protein